VAAIAERQIEALQAQRSSLVIAPTHGECRAIAGAVRKAMKEKGLLSDSEHSVTRLQRLNLTDSQQHDAVTYEPGQIVEFHRMAKGVVRSGVKEKRFKSGEQWEVLRRRREQSLSGKTVSSSICHSTRQGNSVCSSWSRSRWQLATGSDSKNFKHRGQKFLNNEVRTVVSIDESKIIFDKGEIVRTGAALHLDQGIAVTSHASQAKTVDQVIASVPVRSFSQANEAQFYVTMSRARWAMYVFTDSKVALGDAVTRPSRRLSSWELLDLATQNRTLKAALARQETEPKNQQQEVAYER
jgi:hypothetical protein